jgi:hypothetical protein
VIICDITTSTAAFTTSAATGWAVQLPATCGGLGGISWNVANMSGTCGNSTNANWAYYVTLIETQAGGSAGPPSGSRMLMGVGN